MTYRTSNPDKILPEPIPRSPEMQEQSDGNGLKMDISVVIPSLNCIRFIPEHLESIKCWISHVNEVIVVDSHSTDGTLEAFEKHLNHPKLKILTHPPGLYQSWNFGIRQTTSKYVYISTVGDSINVGHLELLESLANRFSADVVVSPPHFIQETGDCADQVRWPIHSIFETFPAVDEIQLGPLATFLFSAIEIPRSILGSSASNLYRGDYLRTRPFPEDCSIAGDTAWSLRYSTEARFHFTRQKGSTFRLHNSDPDMSKSGTLYKIVSKMLGEAEEIAGEFRSKSFVTDEEHRQILLLIHGERAVSTAREDFTAARTDSFLPWYFSKHKRKLRELKKHRISEYLVAKQLLDGLLRSGR